MYFVFKINSSIYFNTVNKLYGFTYLGHRFCPMPDASHSLRAVGWRLIGCGRIFPGNSGLNFKGHLQARWDELNAKFDLFDELLLSSGIDGKRCHQLSYLSLT